MKEKLSTVFSIALCVVLAAAALCIGSVGGWRDERESIAVSEETMAQLHTRAMDAVNLAVVAARHVGEEDASVAALRSAYRSLQQEQLTSSQITQADAAISQAAADLSVRLPELSTVQESVRDFAYVTTLTRTLMAENGLSDSLCAAQEAFNKRISSSLTGRLAMLLGVEPFGVVSPVEVEMP